MSQLLNKSGTPSLMESILKKAETLLACSSIKYIKVDQLHKIELEKYIKFSNVKNIYLKIVCQEICVKKFAVKNFSKYFL